MSAKFCNGKHTGKGIVSKIFGQFLSFWSVQGFCKFHFVVRIFGTNRQTYKHPTSGKKEIKLTCKV